VIDAVTAERKALISPADDRGVLDQHDRTDADAASAGKPFARGPRQAQADALLVVGRDT
jgi:hypothetical protein